ncbi:MAG: helix-turn-helix transcriptional regulator [Chitinophagaceae bacterium]
MDIKAKIGLRIKELRTQQNLTQEAVAWKAEVDRTFMNHIENGKRNASVESLTKIICNGLETSLKDFFNTDLFNGKKRSK